MIFEIPLTNDPAQRFEAILEGTRFFFNAKYNYNADFWTLDIEDSSSVLIQDLVLLPGRNLLGPHEDLTFGQLWMVDQEERNTDPDADNFGDQLKLIFYPPGTEPDFPDLRNNDYFSI